MNTTDLSTDVKISIQREEFAEFILNFLGKKEKLTYTDEFTFHLNHNDIEHIYYLVNEKISKEQNIVIEHFVVTIAYQDKTEREISGIKALNQFLETRYVYPISIQLSWNIVVQFPNAQSIENQSIDLAFLTNEGYIEGAPSEIKDYVKNEHKNSEGRVFLTINHTNQAWGIEVLNLMKDTLCSFMKRKTWQFKLAKKACKLLKLSNVAPILLLIAFGLLVATITFDNTITKSNSAKLYEFSAISESVNSDELFKSFIASTRMTTEDIKKTSNNLIKSQPLKNTLNEIIVIEEKRRSKMLSIFRAFIYLGLMLIFVAYYARYVVRYFLGQSHILLTKRSQENFDFEVASKNQTQYYSFGLVAFVVITGVITNFVTTFLF